MGDAVCGQYLTDEMITGGEKESMDSARTHWTRASTWLHKKRKAKADGVGSRFLSAFQFLKFRCLGVA